MTSWKDRAWRRGAGIVILRPPAEHALSRSLHVLDTPNGAVLAQWHGGIDRWLVLNPDGTLRDVPAEKAGELGWKWLRPATLSDAS
jgi:hypothetical protein